jgi:hypothetical protein
MNLHWLLNNRRSRLPQVTTGEWIELACMLSCWVLVAGYIAAFTWKLDWLYVVSLIPAALSMAAAHFTDWSKQI